MRLRGFVTVKYFLLPVFIAAVVTSQSAFATAFGEQWSPYSAGSKVKIALDPPLPRKGEPFAVIISGKWRDSCVKQLPEWHVGITTHNILLSSWDAVIFGGCGDTWEPTPFSWTIEIDSSAWEQIDEWQALWVTLDLPAGTLHNHEWWRDFDLSWGLHEIPAQIGAGFWVSDEKPFQGLAIQQQNDTVVIYQLTYERDYVELTGEPVWLMGNGRLQGNSTNGVFKRVGYDINVLSPGGPITPPEYQKNPDREDLVINRSSFGIMVNGINSINMGVQRSIFHCCEYKRRVFALGDTQLPAVIPDMSGKWNLYGFNEQNLEQSFQIEFRAGVKEEENGWYRFKSAEHGWELVCQSDWDGVGDCTLLNSELGLKMHYTLLDFNGNYAKSTLSSPDVGVADQTGILLRSGFHLPVLDFQ